MGSVTAVVGGQYGSEGKGAVVAAIANEYDVVVRTGGPNAGHTYYIDALVQGEIQGGTTAIRKALANGKPGVTERAKIVGRSIPNITNPGAKLVIGAGAMLDLHVLEEELAVLDALGINVRPRFYVDERATVITDAQRMVEGGTEGRGHRLIGSTGEGVGLARIAKLNRGIARGSAYLHWECAAMHRDWFKMAGVSLVDTVGWLNHWIDGGMSVLLEGTQGSGLSLTHGVWPYCTSADTNSAQLAADAGIAGVTDAILVCRTFPIRVAGNSGPLANEISWDEVGRKPEVTTVTKKIRRVGIWDQQMVDRAVVLNRPEWIALTFVDYWDNDAYGVTDWDALHVRVQELVREVEAKTGVPVGMVGTGPDSMIRVPVLVS